MRASTVETSPLSAARRIGESDRSLNTFGRAPPCTSANRARGGGICPVSGPIAQGEGAYARSAARVVSTMNTSSVNNGARVVSTMNASSDNNGAR
eukprot:566471-Prorocentrum_minimum.AAC.2